MTACNGHRSAAERRGESTPHFHIFLEADGRSFDASVNVKSRASPSELVFHQALRFEHPMTRGLAETASGFRELARTPQGGGLDYIRGNLFDLADVVALPHDAPGREDDLSDFLESQTRRAIDASAPVFVFGEPFPASGG